MRDTIKVSLSAATLFGLIQVLGCGSTDPEQPAPLKNVLSCAQPAACGIVHAINGDPGFPPATAYSTDQLCALQELAKQTPLRFHYNDGCEGQCFGKVLLVRSDASVIVQPYSQAFDNPGVDLDGLLVEFNLFDGNQLCKLKPKAYFETCQAAFDAPCTSDSNWVTDCAPLTTLSCEP